DSAASGGNDAEIELVIGVENIAAENVIAKRPKRLRKKRPAVTDASGSFHPPKKLRGDYGTSSGAATGGKSSSILKELLASSILNVEVVIAAMATLPLVTSLVSATQERKSGVPTDSITGLNLCTIGASERFIISSDSSHYSSTNTSGSEETGTKITSPVHAFMFHDSDSTETVKADAASPSYSAKQDLSMGSQELNAETLHQVFVPQWNIHEMDYHHLFIEFNVGTARQACLNTEETEATKAVRLRVQVSAAEAVEKVHNDGLVDQVHALETTCSSLRDQVSGYEQLKEQFEEFQDAQMNIVNDKVAKLDANLLEMALHLEEKFYPHFLTTISDQRWLLTHGLKIVVIKYLNWLEYLTALGSAISYAIEKGMHSGLSAGIDHEKAGRSLEDVVSYNPAVEADYNSSLQKLCEVDFHLLTELNSHKDASVADIMDLLCLESLLADAFGMSDLQPDVEQLTLPIHQPEDQVVLGETYLSFALSTSSTSGHVPATIVTTTALSTTFSSASSFPLITTDDYEIVGMDDQEDAQGSVQEMLLLSPQSNFKRKSWILPLDLI
ncbi:hypothetical protein Tco_0078145, partial [Tanacetum coccineum]